MADIEGVSKDGTAVRLAWQWAWSGGGKRNFGGR